MKISYGVREYYGFGGESTEVKTKNV